jgi:uncharacterized protein YqgC (DUF456 family)
VISTSVFILIIALLLVVNTAGIVLTALQLPGNWLIVLATAVVAWLYWDPVASERLIGWWSLAILLGLALLGELFEFLAGAVGTRTGGGTKRAAVLSIPAAIIGAIIGSFAIPIPIVGTVIGAAIGAGLGAFAGDTWAGRNWGEAIRGASGAAVGRLTGTVLKLVVAAALWVTAAVALVV